MPHLPQPVRARAVTVARVIRRAAKSPLPDIQTLEMKAAVRDDSSIPDVNVLASATGN